MSLTNMDFEDLVNNPCKGAKECLDRKPDLDTEECKDCLVDAVGEIYGFLVNDPEREK